MSFIAPHLCFFHQTVTLIKSIAGINENTTITFLPLYPSYALDKASCVRSDPERCGKISLLKYLLVLFRMDFRSYFISFLEEADFFNKSLTVSLRGHIKVPYEITRRSGPLQTTYYLWIQWKQSLHVQKQCQNPVKFFNLKMGKRK